MKRFLDRVYLHVCRNGYDNSIGKSPFTLSFWFIVRLQNYVREQILQAVAVIYKRGTMDMKESGRDGLFADVSQMIASGQPSMVC